MLILITEDYRVIPEDLVPERIRERLEVRTEGMVVDL
jgi:hypothetical protein